MRHSRPAVPGALAVLAILVTGFGIPISSRTQAKIDFARDVQPLLRERCFGCHGPSQQMNGYRLDRRTAALGGVVRPNIVPGSAESSRLYRRIIGSQFGPQMPPTGALPPEEIDVLKQWIDEGAEWPDALANEAELAAPDPDATRIMNDLRVSNRAAVRRQLDDTPGAIKAVGPGGSTPLMYAALYGDTPLVTEMLRKGADPNVRNYVGATALMWALEDVDRVRILLDAGANPNATSDFGRSPLQLASGQARSAAVVKLLLDRGAVPTSTALASAAQRGDASVVRILLAAGAKDTGAGAINALRSNCRDCLDAIAAAQPVPKLTAALNNLLPPAGPGRDDALRSAIERGADVNIKDVQSRTALMRVAVVDAVPPTVVQMLVERGADVHQKTPEGFTALDFARKAGNTPVVQMLTNAGAVSGVVDGPTPTTFVQANTVRDAVGRTLPLLQRTAVQFYKKSGCVSCHHNSLTEMTVAEARQQGFAVDEALARQDVTTVVKDIDATRDQALQGIVIPGGFVTTTGYVLMGLAAERHPSDAATDALVRLLRRSQQIDGHWVSAYRPPFESSEFTATAVSLRGITLYGSRSATSADRSAVAAAIAWLTDARPQSTEDRVFRLFGLTWADASATLRETAKKELVATQGADGGWAQLPSRHSDAYATGEALVALAEAGLRPRDPVYQRGVRFLLNTQLADGSWFVRTRSPQTQIYFESGFPHGVNQYISAAATNWATLALVRSERAIESKADNVSVATITATSGTR